MFLIEQVYYANLVDMNLQESDSGAWDINHFKPT